MSGSIVALAMYDWPEVQAANDDLWSFLAGKLHAAGFATPSALDRSGDYWEPWRSPHLLMAQTCGYPFATVLRGHVRLIGTPCYGVPGCQGPDYSSVIVANRRSGLNNLKDLKKCTAAINSLTSQ